MSSTIDLNRFLLELDATQQQGDATGNRLRQSLAAMRGYDSQLKIQAARQEARQAMQKAKKAMQAAAAARQQAEAAQRQAQSAQRRAQEQAQQTQQGQGPAAAAAETVARTQQQLMAQTQALVQAANAAQAAAQQAQAAALMQAQAAQNQGAAAMAEAARQIAEAQAVVQQAQAMVAAANQQVTGLEQQSQKQEAAAEAQVAAMRAQVEQLNAAAAQTRAPLQRFDQERLELGESAAQMSSSSAVESAAMEEMTSWGNDEPKALASAVYGVDPLVGRQQSLVFLPAYRNTFLNAPEAQLLSYGGPWNEASVAASLKYAEAEAYGSKYGAVAGQVATSASLEGAGFAYDSNGGEDYGFSYDSGDGEDEEAFFDAAQRRLRSASEFALATPEDISRYYSDDAEDYGLSNNTYAQDLAGRPPLVLDENRLRRLISVIMPAVDLAAPRSLPTPESFDSAPLATTPAPLVDGALDYINRAATALQQRERISEAVMLFNVAERTPPVLPGNSPGQGVNVWEPAALADLLAFGESRNAVSASERKQLAAAGKALSAGKGDAMAIAQATQAIGGALTLDPSQLMGAADYVNVYGAQANRYSAVMQSLLVMQRVGTPPVTRSQLRDNISALGVPDYIFERMRKGLSPAADLRTMNDTLQMARYTPGGQQISLSGESYLEMRVSDEGRLIESKYVRPKGMGFLDVALMIASVIPWPGAPIAAAINAGRGVVQSAKDGNILGMVVAGASFVGGAAKGLQLGNIGTVKQINNIAKWGGRAQSIGGALKNGDAGNVLGAIASVSGGIATDMTVAGMSLGPPTPITAARISQLEAISEFSGYGARISSGIKALKKGDPLAGLADFTGVGAGLVGDQQQAMLKNASLNLKVLATMQQAISQAAESGSTTNILQAMTAIANGATHFGAGNTEAEKDAKAFAKFAENATTVAAGIRAAQKGNPLAAIGSIGGVLADLGGDKELGAVSDNLAFMGQLYDSLRQGDAAGVLEKILSKSTSADVQAGLARYQASNRFIQAVAQGNAKGALQSMDIVAVGLSRTSVNGLKFATPQEAQEYQAELDLIGEMQTELSFRMNGFAGETVDGRFLPTTTYQVQAGDTLQSIAAADFVRFEQWGINASGWKASAEDLELRVAQYQSLNSGLQDGLQAGQTLMMPAAINDGIPVAGSYADMLQRNRLFGDIANIIKSAGDDENALTERLAGVDLQLFQTMLTIGNPGAVQTAMDLRAQYPALASQGLPDDSPTLFPLADVERQSLFGGGAKLDAFLSGDKPIGSLLGYPFVSRMEEYEGALGIAPPANLVEQVSNYQRSTAIAAEFKLRRPGSPEALKFQEIVETEKTLRFFAVTDNSYGNALNPLAIGQDMVDRAQLETRGLILDDPASGYSAVLVYDNVLQTYIFANRGTEPKMNDIITNGQGVGIATRQYDIAQKNALILEEITGGNIIYTGHSLGAGMGFLQSLLTGRQGVGFNSAGVNRDNLQRYNVPIANIANAGELFTSVIVRGEILDTVQKSPLLDLAALTLTTLPRNLYELARGVVDPNYTANFGFGYLPRAQGTLSMIPPYDAAGQPIDIRRGLFGLKTRGMLHLRTSILYALEAKRRSLYEQLRELEAKTAARQVS